MKPKVVLFTMGGTISAKGKNETDLKDYISGLISGTELLKEIPQIEEIAKVTIEAVDHISSTQINEQHWLTLKQQLEYYLEEKNYTGAIISHGTNTLEETAYFLHLTVNSEKPIVLVGAQRPFTALSTDVHLNLLNAFQVVTAKESIGKGVLVVMNNEIHSARDVTKGHTYRMNAFHSGDLGMLGLVEADHTVQYYRSPIKYHTTTSAFKAIDPSMLKIPKVEIIYSYAGTENHLIDYIVDSELYDGIVIAGTGAGRFSKMEEKALMRARKKGLHIVRCSRVGKGRVIDIEPFEELKAIAGDNLLVQKARILLMLSLVKFTDVKDIEQIFLTH